MKNWYVNIVRKSDGEIVQHMGPMPERRAEKVEDGANINLNHEEYYTEMVGESQDEEDKP